MIRWEIELVGDSVNIADFRMLLEDSVHAVTERDGQVWLTSPEFEAMPSANEVHDRAKVIVQRLTDYAHLRFPYRASPVKIGQVSEVVSGAPAKRHLFASMSAMVVSFRGHAAGLAMGPDGNPILPPIETMPTFDKFESMLGADQEILRAVELMRTGSHDFTSLNKVYEIIKYDLDSKGAYDKLIERGWASKDELDQFYANKDDHRLVGDRLARHTKPMKGPPKASPMTIHEAQNLIQRIYEQWIRSKNV